MNFFAIFLEFSSLGKVWTEFGTKMFFSLSRPVSFPFRLEIMPEWGFLVFWIFLLFFSEFSCRGRVWMKFGTKFFFTLSRPISSHFWLKIMPLRIFFFNFLNFFAIFFGIFWPGSARNRIRDYNFFLSFSFYLIPFSLKIIPERSFFIFWIFLLFF